MTNVPSKREAMIDAMAALVAVILDGSAEDAIKNAAGDVAEVRSEWMDRLRGAARVAQDAIDMPDDEVGL